MSEFTLHTNPISPYGRAVMITLEEKGADYLLAPVPVGTLKSEPHLSRHPFGMIPALAHGDFMLYETQAILRYLDRAVPAHSLTPAHIKAAARMDQLMNINDIYLFLGFNRIVGFHRIVGPRFMGTTPDEDAITAAMPMGHTTFNELGRLLGGKAYFVGDTPSLADFMIAPQLDFLAQIPEWDALTASNANLVSWLERMKARPSMVKTSMEKLLAEAA